MPIISVLIPSLRPKMIAKRIADFAVTNGNVDYELVVVSPFPVSGKRVVHVPEERQVGVIAAANVAYAHASGEYLVYSSDDAPPTPNNLSRMLAFVQSFPEPFVGAFRLQDLEGKELEQWSVYGNLYACWGCLSRRTISKVGGLFDPVYGNYWADPDLGMRTWAWGGRVEVCPDAWMWVDHIKDEISARNHARTFERDTAAFFSRWHAAYGRGVEKVWTLINTPVPVADLGASPRVERRAPEATQGGLGQGPIVEAAPRGGAASGRAPEGRPGCLVSALVPTYNAERFMRGLLEDLEGQTIARRMEIVIVDTGSPQNERAIVEEFQRRYDNIVYIRTEVRENSHAALNRAIQASRGKYLTLACTDDRHQRDGLEVMVKALGARSDVALVYADSAITTAENQTFDTAPVLAHFRWPAFDPGLLFHGNFIGPHPMWRRDLHERYGLFDASLEAAGDYEFWLRMAWRETFVHIPETLGLYLKSPMSLEHRQRDVCQAETELARQRYWPAGRGPLPPFDSDFFVPVTAESGGPTRAGGEAGVGRPQPAAVAAPGETHRGPGRIVAIMAAHNEGDVISHVIGDLIANGVEVYLIDNASTDNTVEEASRWLGKGLRHIERFPKDSGYPERAAREYVWRDLLRRKEEVALTLGADWYIHADADEFRESPWPGRTLAEAIGRVDALGYNAINFELLNFRPTDDGFVAGSDVRRHLTHYEGCALFDALQIKAWKNTGEPVVLVDNGGHSVAFAGRRVFPIPFILRHYPLRGETHGRRKVFMDRVPRFAREERATGWHVQYDPLIRGEASFLWDPATLSRYDGNAVRAQLLGRAWEDLLLVQQGRGQDAIVGAPDAAALCAWVGSTLGLAEPVPLRTVEQASQALTELMAAVEQNGGLLPAPIQREAMAILLAVGRMSEARARLQGDTVSARRIGKLSEQLRRQAGADVSDLSRVGPVSGAGWSSRAGSPGGQPLEAGDGSARVAPGSTVSGDPVVARRDRLEEGGSMEASSPAVWRGPVGTAVQERGVADGPLGPVGAEARAARGLSLLAQGRTREAIADLEEAARHSADAGLWNNLGCAYAVVGRASEAEATLGRAIAADAMFREARLNLADLYRSQGRWDKAMQHYRVAVELFPNDGTAREGLELCLRQNGHRAKALPPGQETGEALERVACNLCGRSDHTVLSPDQPATLVRCPGCGLVFFNPQPTEAALRAHYRVPDASLQAVAADPAPRMESKREILDLVQRYASPPGTLLDVGCANGEFLAVARDGGWDVTGFEASPVSAAFARATFGLRVEEGLSLADIGFPATQFDVVTLQHVLEHHKDPRGTLGEVRRIMRAGGLVWVMVPNFASLLAQTLGPRWEWKSYPNHLFYFTPDTLRALAEAAGFTVVEVLSRTGDADRRVYAEVLRQLYGDEDATRRAERMRTLDQALLGPELLMALQAAPLRATVGTGGGARASAAPSGEGLSALIQAGADHLAAGRAAEAVEAFQTAVGMAPHLAEVRSALGSALLKLGRTAEAVGELTAAAEALETSEAWNNLGCAYAVAGRAEEARAALLKAIELDDTNREPQRNLAALFEAMGMPKEAAAAYDLLLLTEPEDSEALAGKARCAATSQARGIAGRPAEPRGVTAEPVVSQGACSAPERRRSVPPASMMERDEYQRRVQAEKAIYSREYRKPESRETLTEETCPALGHILDRSRELERAATGGADFWEYLRRAAVHRGAPRILSLGSGPGGAELELARQLPRAASIDCIDINEELVALGQSRAAADGLNVRFQCQDLNTLRLEPEAYDLIMTNALHHFLALEHIFAEVHRALKPDGELVVNDIIARNGLRLWPETKALIGHVWSLLPERFRLNHTLYGSPRVDSEYPDRDFQGDGFESVRSQDILPLLRERFQVVHYAPYFGFSRRFFDRMHGPNYDLDQPLDRAIVEFIWQLDCELVRTGKVRPEVAFLVLRRKDGRDGGRE